MLSASKTLFQAGVKKALSCSSLLSITRGHLDLEFLVPRWSFETHTFIVARGGVHIQSGSCDAADYAYCVRRQECHRESP